MPHRYFASEIDGATAALTGPDAHHLGKVMRAKPGDAVILCDGAGFDYTAAVTSVTPDRVEFALLEKRPTVYTTNIVDGKAFEARYTEKIASRLGGSCEPVLFLGQDIRKLKSME